MEYSPTARRNSITHLASDWFTALPRLSQIGVALVLFGLAIFLYLAQASVVANLSLQIVQYEARIQELKNRNEVLRVTIAQEERLPVIMERAAALGLGPQDEVLYGVVEVSPTFTSVNGELAIPAGGAPNSTLAQGTANSWWNTIVDQFAAWMSRPGG